MTMGNGTREVKLGTEVVTAAGHAFLEITRLVTQVSDQVNEISLTIEQMAVGSQQIVSSVNQIDSPSKNVTGEAQLVSAATEEQSASMEEIASACQSLATLAQNLRDSVSKFIVWGETFVREGGGSSKSDQYVIHSPDACQDWWSVGLAC